MEETELPDIVDVRWVRERYSIKDSLQAKLRQKGILPYISISGTRKIFYKRNDVEKLFGDVASDDPTDPQ